MNIHSIAQGLKRTIERNKSYENKKNYNLLYAEVVQRGRIINIILSPY